jgi:hypothetical protein
MTSQVVRTTRKSCRHNWDVSTLIWTTSGQRAHPCKKCGEVFVYGSVRVRKAD